MVLYWYKILEGCVVNENIDMIYRELFLRNNYSLNISVFISGVEHIGTSWCALTLAHALNLEKQKVLLVDGNGNLSNISSYIQLNSPLYLEDYVNGKKTLNQLLTAYKNKDFNILTAIPGNNYLENLPLGRVQVYSDDLCLLAKDYMQAIIDIGTTLTEKNLGLCRLAKSIFVVCSEKSSDLIKTFETLRYLYKNGINGDFYLIINRVNSFEDGYKIYKELSKALERNGLTIPNLLGIIRFDTRVRDTIRNKELHLTRYPSSEAAVDICHIAQKLLEESKNG